MIATAVATFSAEARLSVMTRVPIDAQIGGPLCGNAQTREHRLCEYGSDHRGPSPPPRRNHHVTEPLRHVGRQGWKGMASAATSQ